MNPVSMGKVSKHKRYSTGELTGLLLATTLFVVGRCATQQQRVDSLIELEGLSRYN